MIDSFFIPIKLEYWTIGLKYRVEETSYPNIYVNQLDEMILESADKKYIIHAIGTYLNTRYIDYVVINETKKKVNFSTFMDEKILSNPPRNSEDFLKLMKKCGELPSH